MANDTDVSEQFIKTPMAMQNAFCRIRIPGEARQVLDSIIRWTIGWQQRTKHPISIGILCKMTGIKRSNVIRSVKCLEDMHIILSDRANRITAYEINLSYEEWQSKPKHQTGIRNDTNQSGIINDTEVGIINDTDAGIINDTEIGIVNDTHNRKKEKKKENTHIESLRASEFSFSDFLKTATDFCEKVFQYHPKCKHESVEMSAKILAGIGESPDEISRAIEFGFADTEFWRSILKSATQFAKNFGTIQSQMNRVKKVSRTSNQKTLKRMLDELTGFE
jgi:phage replication O-like protein O